MVQEEISFNDLSILALVAISAILAEGIMGNIQVKLFETWTSGLGGDTSLQTTHDSSP